MGLEQVLTAVPSNSHGVQLVTTALGSQMCELSPAPWREVLAEAMEDVTAEPASPPVVHSDGRESPPVESFPNRFPRQPPTRPESPIFSEFCASRIFPRSDSPALMDRSLSVNSVLHVESAMGAASEHQRPACVCLPPVRSYVGKLSDRLPATTFPSALGPCLDCRPLRRSPSADCLASGAEAPCQGPRFPPCGEYSSDLEARIHLSRQTVGFVRRKVATHGRLSHGCVGVWSVLAALDRRVDPGSRARALRVAAACHARWPDVPWAPLVGLLSGLGQALMLPEFGAEPRWAALGESFPVGCRIDPTVAASSVRFANPDRHRREYSSPTGMYRGGCGLGAVHMCWTGPEYLYLVLVLNKVQLPEEALFLLRYQAFSALFRPGKPYSSLLDTWDLRQLPRLVEFQRLLRLADDAPALSAQAEDELERACDRLMLRYLPAGGVLRW